jgi:hypothetical protein
MRSNTKIVFEMFDTSAKPTARFTCNSRQTDVSTLKNEKPDRKKYATTEPNEFLLDGGCDIARDLPSGLYSRYMSGTDGKFTTPVVLNVRFTKPITSTGITLYFPQGELAGNIKIKWTDSGNILKEAEYTPDSDVYFCTGKVENYTGLSVTFYATQTPRHYLKLAGMDFGQMIEFKSDKIVSAETVSEIDILCDEIRINTLEFTVEDKEKLFSVVSKNSVFFASQENQKISVYSEFDGEEVKLGTYFLQNIKNTGITASFTAGDVIGLLDGDGEIPDTYFDTDLESFCQSVLAGYKYNVADELKKEPIKGYIKSCGKREALQQACFAAGAIVDTRGGETINLVSAENRPSQLLTSDKIFAGGTTESIKAYNSVHLTVHKFTADGQDSPTVLTECINPRAKGDVKVEDACFVNLINGFGVLKRLKNAYGNKVLYNVSLPLTTLFKMGDMLMAYIDESYIKGNITKMNINLSKGLTADITIEGEIFEMFAPLYAGEAMAGERSYI